VAQEPVPYGLETLPTSISIDPKKQNEKKKFPKIKNLAAASSLLCMPPPPFLMHRPPRADVPARRQAARVGLSLSSFMGDYDEELPSPADPYEQRWRCRSGSALCEQTMEIELRRSAFWPGAASL
jgi:hypothetical protein